MDDSHSDLILLIDALGRLRGRLRSAFTPARELFGLSEIDHTVLSAVTEAKRPPTVAQIGRSLGHPRQMIQRSANALAAAGLVEFTENPDHARASLLIPTGRGNTIQHEANERAEAIARDLLTTIDARQVRDANRLLNSIRAAIERHGKETPQ